MRWRHRKGGHDPDAPGFDIVVGSDVRLLFKLGNQLVVDWECSPDTAEELGKRLLTAAKEATDD